MLNPIPVPLPQQTALSGYTGGARQARAAMAAVLLALGCLALTAVHETASRRTVLFAGADLDPDHNPFAGSGRGKPQCLTRNPEALVIIQALHTGPEISHTLKPQTFKTRKLQIPDPKTLKLSNPQTRWMEQREC